MDSKTQKERLEQELRFLKESFDAEVISKEEFEKGKERIEKKLREIQSLGEKIDEAKKEQIPEKQPKEEQKKDEAIEVKEEEKIKLKVIQEAEENKNLETQKIEPKITELASEKSKVEEQKKRGSKFIRYGVVFVILAIVLFFSYSFFNVKKTTEEKTAEMKFIALCNSNEDCKSDGKIGICTAPGSQDAKCEFKEIQKIDVVMLNDRKNCFNCDTQRIVNILESWFGEINAKESDLSTEEGKSIAEKFNVSLLPLYILDENITKKEKFEKYKQIFVKKNGNYILSEEASASTFYFKRSNAQNRLDFFAIAGDDASIKAERNLKEFLDNFNEVKFEKHLSNATLTKELKIKTFPTFLINNRIKFSGVYSAESIKENFCKLNELKECEKNLSKSLV